MARISDTERLIWEQHATITDLRARLAEAEADRDAWQRDFQAQFDRAATAEARLAAVLALCDDLTQREGVSYDGSAIVRRVRAALRGPQDDYAEKTRDLLEANRRMDDAYPEVTRDEVQHRTGMTEEQMDGLLRHFGVSPETVRPVEEIERALSPSDAEQMLAELKRDHAAAWAEQNRPNLGPVRGPQDEEAAEDCGCLHYGGRMIATCAQHTAREKR